MILSLDTNVDDTESGELAENLLLIVTIFIARRNGLISAKNQNNEEKLKTQNIWIYLMLEEREKLRK